LWAKTIIHTSPKRFMRYLAFQKVTRKSMKINFKITSRLIFKLTKTISRLDRSYFYGGRGTWKMSDVKSAISY
jgi:hypothetical protein